MKDKLTIEDLAMFLSCDCIVHRKHGQDLIGKNTIGLLNSFQRDIESEYSSNWSIENIKPILRPLSDMTTEEAMELIRINHPESTHKVIECVTINNGAVQFKANDGKMKYSVLFQIGFFDNYSPNEFKWLILKQFDVFNWIDQGLAIKK
jgi:hypothetical protein